MEIGERKGNDEEWQNSKGDTGGYALSYIFATQSDAIWPKDCTTCCTLAALPVEEAVWKLKARIR
jgi:hypothetical protein